MLPLGRLQDFAGTLVVAGMPFHHPQVEEDVEIGGGHGKGLGEERGSSIELTGIGQGQANGKAGPQVALGYGQEARGQLVGLGGLGRQIKRCQPERRQVGRLLLGGRQMAQVAEGFGSVVVLHSNAGELDVGVEVPGIQGHHAEVGLARAGFIAGAQEVVGVVVPDVRGVGRGGGGAAVHLAGFGKLPQAVEGDTQKAEGPGVVRMGTNGGLQGLFGGGKIAAVQGG